MGLKNLSDATTSITKESRLSYLLRGQEGAGSWKKKMHPDKKRKLYQIGALIIGGALLLYYVTHKNQVSSFLNNNNDNDNILIKTPYYNEQTISPKKPIGSFKPEEFNPNYFNPRIYEKICMNKEDERV